MIMLNKSTICLLLLIFSISTIKSNGQPKEIHSPFYVQAYEEMTNMLAGKIPLSIKRAVFLTEWAFLDGKPNYNAYCQDIDSTAYILKQFITTKQLNKYHTGGNYALFEYFSRPSPMNGNKPFTYDFEDFAGSDDFTKLFVTKLMQTHSGQCRSLPMYYKVLAEAIGAEAYITLVPQHLFVRHRDETDRSKWVNIELTTQSLSRDIFYIENFGISDEAIRNKVYMNPLTDKETVAYLMSELLVGGYVRKYGDWDEFVGLCATKSLTYFPQDAGALQNKGNVLNIRLINHLKKNGGIMDHDAQKLNEAWLENHEHLMRLGFTKISEEMYLQKLQQTLETMKKNGHNTAKIETEIKQIKTQKNK